MNNISIYCAVPESSCLHFLPCQCCYRRCHRRCCCCCYLSLLIVDNGRQMTNRRPRHMSILIADLYNKNPDGVQIAEQKNMYFFVQQSVRRRYFHYVNRLLKLTCDVGVC